MRLIDGDAFKDLMMSLAYDDWNQGVNTSLADAFRGCARRVEEAPTVDAVPVVHGRWETDGMMMDDGEYLMTRCTACGTPYEYGYDMPFCPNCGARMDGGENEAD